MPAKKAKKEPVAEAGDVEMKEEVVGSGRQAAQVIVGAGGMSWRGGGLGERLPGTARCCTQPADSLDAAWKGVLSGRPAW